MTNSAPMIFFFIKQEQKQQTLVNGIQLVSKQNVNSECQSNEKPADSRSAPDIQLTNRKPGN